MNSVLDDALERLRGMGPEARHGAPNHGPMAAEALVAIGCLDDVPRWVDDYRGELDPMPAARSPVTEETWHEALGVIHRVGDWQTFFVARLAEAPWQAVLGTEVVVPTLESNVRLKVPPGTQGGQRFRHTSTSWGTVRSLKYCPCRGNGARFLLQLLANQRRDCTRRLIPILCRPF